MEYAEDHDNGEILSRELPAYTPEMIALQALIDSIGIDITE